jgi:hypothetical protein
MKTFLHSLMLAIAIGAACTEGSDDGAGGAGGDGGDTSAGATGTGGAGGTGGVPSCPIKTLPTSGSGLVVSAAEFASKKITLANIGSVEIANQDHWVCNGSRCESLDSVGAIAAGAQVTATLFVPRLRAEGGELAIFASSDVRNPAELRAYVRWGRPDEEGRVAAAVTAKLWPSVSEAVTVPTDSLGFVMVGKPGSAAGFAATPSGCSMP